MLSSTILQSVLTGGLTLKGILITTGASIVLGLIIAFLHMYKNQYNKNFVVTLAVLPMIVQMIIMLVNGNLGTGVAVAGAFILVGFRSAP